MCMITSYRATKKFKDEHIGQDTIRVWKIYLKKENHLVSPYRHQHICRPGVIKSNRRSKRLIKGGTDFFYRRRFGISRVWEVNPGIHVFLTREEARATMDFLESHDCVIVCCHVKMKDLVGIGIDYCKGQAVFMKVTISSSNFRKSY